MSFFIITPIVGISWPLLSPLVMTVAGALGYKAMVDMKDGGDLNDLLRKRLHETTAINLRVDDLVIDAMQEEVRRAESMYFQKGEIALGIIRDERGKLRIEVLGPKGADPKVLQQEGRQFAEELAQLFAQNRALQELERMGMDVVEEVVDEEKQEIVLKVRRWT